MSSNSTFIESSAPAMTPVTGCGCDWRGTVADADDVNGTGAILEAGDASPAGRCPECGCLVYLDRAGDRARDNAPAMLAALQRFSALPDAMAAYARAHGDDWQSLVAILARIDGAPTAEPADPTGDDAGEGEKVETVEDAAAMVRDGLELLETVDFVDDGAMEDGTLFVVPAEGPGFRVAITLWER